MEPFGSLFSGIDAEPKPADVHPHGLHYGVRLFVCLLLHELSHSVVARRHGVKVSSITLFLFGGVAEMKTDHPSARAEFQIALAGPVMSFLLAGFFSLAAEASLKLGLTAPFTRVLSYLGAVNLALAVFNLLPAFPLDGGRVLRAWLWQRTGNVVKATKIAAKFGQILIGVFLMTAAKTSYEQQVKKLVFSHVLPMP